MARAGSQINRLVLACTSAPRWKTLTVAGTLISVIAFSDYLIGLNISLGALYAIPMILAGVALSARPLTAVALGCAIFRMLFDNPNSGVEAILRFAFAFLAYTSVGLFVSTLLKNQRQTVEHMQGMKREQSLRAQAEDQLKALVESSPAAILTLDHQGNVLAANNSAADLFGYASAGAMAGISIEPHLPVLREALRLDTGGESFRTAAQSRARRADGNLFLADMWFSTYGGPDGKRLAAIIVDSSEEMREREEQNLRQLSAGSSILASAVLHEVRNLCSAFSVVSANLKQREEPCRIADLQPLDSLVNGLARITSFELQRKEPANLESVSVCRLLDELRIIIEPSWDELDGQVQWDLPQRSPRAAASRHALLQVFLNLAQNSLRAVENCDVRELRIEVCVMRTDIVVRFQDTGPGVSDPAALFQPFQATAASSGLGLYISRALMRNLGGELEYIPGTSGACFQVQIPAFEEEEGA